MLTDIQKMWDGAIPVGAVFEDDEHGFEPKTMEDAWNEAVPFSRFPLWDNRNMISGFDFNRVKRGFEIGSDPLQSLPDNVVSDLWKMRYFNNVPDVDAEKRKLAVAGFFSGMKSQNLPYVYDNLEPILEEFYGTPTTPDAAYLDLQKTQFDVLSVGNKAAAAFMSGVARQGATAHNAVATAFGVLPGEPAKKIRDTYRGFARQCERMRNDLNRLSDTGDLISSDWFSNGVKLLLSESTPLLTQFAAGTVGGPALGLGMIGFTTANDKYYEITENNPEMSAFAKWSNVAGTGLVNALLEKVSFGIIEGKFSEKVAKEGLKKGIPSLLNYYGVNMTKEGASESLEQISENALDYATGKIPDGEKRELGLIGCLLRGVPESAFVGGVSGGGFAAPHQGSLRKRAEVNGKNRARLIQERDAFAAIPEKSSEQTEMLRLFNSVLASGDPDGINAIASGIESQHKILDDPAAGPDVRTMFWNGTLDENALPLAESEKWEDAVSEADRHRYMQALRHRVPFNPDQTGELADEYIRANYPGLKYHIANFNETSLPENIRSILQAEGSEPSRVRGCWDPETETMYLNTGNTRPEDAAAVVDHEIAAHKGLKKLIGEERFNSALDRVFSQFRSEVEAINSIYDFDLDTADGQRAAAEEYLAECAEFGGKNWRSYYEAHRDEIDLLKLYSHESMLFQDLLLNRDADGFRSGATERRATMEYMRLTGDFDKRPGWWREILQGVKMTFKARKGYEFYDFTDREIETMLLRSKRKQRRGGTVPGAVPRFALFDNIDKRDSIFNALSKIANGSEEETISNLRNDLEQYGGTNDITLPWGNSKKGIFHIAYRRGTETLFHVIDALSDGKINRYVPGNKTVHLEKDGYEAILSLDENGKRKSWLLTGWETDKPDAIGKFSSKSDATQIPPTFSRRDLGAGLNKIISQNPGKVKGNAKFSIIGERGAENLETQRLFNLSTAREMLESGLDMAKIKLATGWEKGGDGKWRTETDDDRTSWYFSDPSNDISGERLAQGELAEFLYDPVLFAAYPELKHYPVVFEDLPNGSYGSFNRTNREFIIKAVPKEDWGTPAAAYRQADQKRIFRHEIQHAIQQIEGFARGGNMESVKGKTAQLWHDVQPLYRKMIESRNWTEYRRLSNRMKEVLQIKDAAEAEKAWNNLVTPEFEEEYGKIREAEDVAEILREQASLSEKYGKYDPLVAEAIGNPSHDWDPVWGKLSEKDAEGSFERYRRLAGEVEARNAEFRSSMDIGDRMKTLLSSTEDVAEKDKIYLEQAAGAEMMAEERPYYQIPFAESLKKVVAPGSTVRYPVFVSETTAPLKAIGLPRLPMMMSPRHIRLNYFTKTEFEAKFGKVQKGENTHALHDVLEKLPVALEHPIAIVGNFAQSAHENSLIVITDVNVNGKKVIVPVKIGVESMADDMKIDAHLILTVYDNTNWMEKIVKPAIEAEKNGIGVFYLDKEKAGKYAAFGHFGGRISSGVVHNIAEAGINFKPQTETLQFKRWFGDSKVVDKDGKPLAVYHRSSERFTVFDKEKIGSASDPGVYGEGFYFSDQDLKQYGPKRYKCYLSLQNPFICNHNELYDLRFGNRRNPDMISEDGNRFQTEYLKSKGYDGVIVIGDKYFPTEYVAFDPIQIKSATDNTGTFDGNNPDIWYSLDPDAELDFENYVGMIQEFIGRNPLPEDDSELVKFFSARGIDVTEREAHAAAVEALHRNRSNAKKAEIQRTKDWIMENEEFAVKLKGLGIDLFGGFTLKPAPRFQGEDFSGSFISPEFVRYSETPSGKRTAKYRENRLRALKSAKGKDSDDLAKEWVRKYGGDELTVEQNLVDHFRDLKIRDLYQLYWNHQEEIRMENRKTEDEAKAYLRESEDASALDAAMDIVNARASVDETFIRENRAVFNKLYQIVFRKDAPASVGKTDLEALNDSLRNSENLNDYANAYKSAKGMLTREFNERYNRLKEALAADKTDLEHLQKEAEASARKYLPPEERGRFVHDIVALSGLSGLESRKTGISPRMKRFDEIVSGIFERSKAVRKERAVNEIKDMIQATRVKRNWKGIPTSVLPSVQEEVNRIADIIGLSMGAVASRITANQEIINASAKLNPGADEAADAKALKAMEDNERIAAFCNLNELTVEHAEAARDRLKALIRSGKQAFREKLETRLDELTRIRNSVIRDVTGGSMNVSGNDSTILKRQWDYTVNNENLLTLLQTVHRKMDDDFFKTEGGALWEQVEQSTWKEDTLRREEESALDGKLKEILKTDGMFDFMRKKARFFDLLHERKKSGVFMDRYILPPGEKDDINRKDRRPSVKVEMPAEIARMVLEDMDKGARIDGALQVDGKNPGNLFEIVRNSSGQPLFGHFRLFRTEDGYRIYSWRDGSDGKPEVRKFDVRRDLFPPEVGEHIVPMDPVTVKFAKKQLADYDAGLRFDYGDYVDPADDAQYQRMTEEETKYSSVRFLFPKPGAEKENTELELSQGNAMQLLLTWEQEDYRDAMRWNGWSDSSIKQLKEYIKPEVLALGHWMRDHLKEQRSVLDKISFERYGAHLPEIKNYFPARFKSDTKKLDIGVGRGGMNMNPAFLISRKFHLKVPDIGQDFFAVYMGNVLEQNHFIAWTETIRNLVSVYGHPEVEAAIDQNAGKNVREAIVDRIKVLANGGVEADGLDHFMSSFYDYWIPSKIALNAGSILKQICGAGAYMNDIPITSFLKNLSENATRSEDYQEFIDRAKKSDYFKNRIGGNLNKELAYMLHYQTTKRHSAFSDAMVNLGTKGTLWADSVSTLRAGYAVYKYHLDLNRKAGMDENQAKTNAMKHWMRSTDHTQQSAALKDQNFYQSNKGPVRYLTAFMTNPIQVMNLQMQTLNHLRFGSKESKKKAMKKFARQVAVNHLLVAPMMQLITDLLRNGFDFDEYNFTDYLKAAMLGSFEALFVYGKVIGAAWELLTKRNPWKIDSFDAIPLLTDVKRSAGSLWKLIDPEKENTERDLIRGIKSVGDLMVAAGAWNSTIGAAGTVISGGAREIGRVEKLANGKDKKGKRL